MNIKKKFIEICKYCYQLLHSLFSVIPSYQKVDKIFQNKSFENKNFENKSFENKNKVEDHDWIIF